VSSPVLAIEGLCAALRPAGSGRALLRGVSLAVAAGEVHGLVGMSGAGKSLIAKATLGLLPAAIALTGGAIRFAGAALTDRPEADHRRLLGRDIALIPQDPLTALNPSRRIEAQMTDVMRLHQSLTRRAARARARALLEDVQIRDPDAVLRRYPHELSGGMRQRVLIAVAFACEPRLIIADEPTTALDVTVQKEILRLIRDLQHRQGTAILFVTHDLGVVAKICQRVSVMHAGMILEHGMTDAIMTAPQHPFTRALFAATPRHDRPADALSPVPASVLRDIADTAHRFDTARAS
jgi:peptide/nickel transport system ATP-binding protein